MEHIKHQHTDSLTENRTELLPDMTDIDEVRRAIIANEILQRKY